VEGQAGNGIAGDDPLLGLECYAHILILPPRRTPDRLEDVRPSGTSSPSLVRPTRCTANWQTAVHPNGCTVARLLGGTTEGASSPLIGRPKSPLTTA
jgi:hypothetical protein